VPVSRSPPRLSNAVANDLYAHANEFALDPRVRAPVDLGIGERLETLASLSTLAGVRARGAT